MELLREINLEYGRPISGVAMDRLQKEIAVCKANKIRCLYIIHGYGSSGNGGVICKKVRQWLFVQQKKGTIKSVIPGEDFDIFNIKALELKAKYPELKKIINNHNGGVTVIEL